MSGPDSSAAASTLAFHEASPDGFMLFAPVFVDGEIVDFEYRYVNASAYRVLKIEPGSLQGKRMIELYPGVKKSGFFDRYRDAYLGRTRHVFEDYYGSDAVDAWFRVSAARGGDLLAVSFADVTEAKRLADRAAEEAAINESLVRSGNVLGGELDLEGIVQRLTEESTRVCRAEFGAFFWNVVVAERGEAFKLFTIAGAMKDRFDGFPLPRATPIFGHTFNGNGAMRYDDIRTHPKFGAWGPQPKGHLPVVSYLALPVISRDGTVYGGLFFGHSSPGVFTARDEKIVQALAAQAAIAIDNARLFERVKRARKQLVDTFEQAPVAVAVLRGDDHVYQLTNPSYRELIGGVDPDGKPAREALPELEGQGIFELLDHVVTSGERVVRSELPAKLTRDGRLEDVCVNVVVEPVRGAEGKPEGVIIVATDVSEHVHARKRLEDTEAQLRFLSSVGEALVATRDPDATLRTLAALSVPTLADWCWIDVFDEQQPTRRVAVTHARSEDAQLAAALAGFPADLDREHPSLAVLESGRAVLLETIDPEMLRRACQSEEHFALVRSVRGNSSVLVPLVVRGRVHGVMTMVVSEASQRTYGPRERAVAEELGRRASLALENAVLFAEAQAEKNRAEVANRAKDEFLATVSHELRTPLTAMLGWVHMLRTGTLDESKKKRALETIERNAKTQAQLVEDVLDVSRIITGKLRLEVADVDVAKVVEAAIDVVRPAAEAKGVQLQVALEPDAGMVVGDPDRLQQVFWNLLTNAVKFTPRGGRVLAHLARSGANVELSVEDTGKGMDPAFLPYVFDRFRQENGAITRLHGGLGLGLAIVKHLTELHGGTVTAHSDGEGRGARFVVQIPARAQRNTPEVVTPVRKADQPFVAPAALAGLEVLVVDDEADARDLLEAMLSDARARVVTAPSAHDALSQLQNHRFDVIVSDIGMPGQDGYALMRAVRALAPECGGRTPAVALTAYARAEDRTRALLAGFNTHVAKPIDPRELLLVLTNVTGRFS